jgi:hypothetical protein
MSEIDNGSLRRWNTKTSNATAFAQEYIIPYLNIAKDCEGNLSCFGPEMKQYSSSSSVPTDYMYYIKLTDGTRWAIRLQNTNHFHIYVDTNGDKKPNKLGNDVFQYTVPIDALNDGYHKIDAPGVYYYGSGLDRAALLSNCTGVGEACAALIAIDGDKINY